MRPKKYKRVWKRWQPLQWSGSNRWVAWERCQPLTQHGSGISAAKSSAWERFQPLTEHGSGFNRWVAWERYFSLTCLTRPTGTSSKRSHRWPGVGLEPCLGANASPVAIKQVVYESRMHGLTCLLGQIRLRNLKHCCMGTRGNASFFRTGGSENGRPWRHMEPLSCMAAVSTAHYTWKRFQPLSCMAAVSTADWTWKRYICINRWGAWERCQPLTQHGSGISTADLHGSGFDRWIVSRWRNRFKLDIIVKMSLYGLVVCLKGCI